MSARADLLATADGLAAAAKRTVGDGTSTTGADVAAGLATAAKAALEAAALADRLPVGAVEQALDSIQDLLGEAGVLDESIDREPAEFLDRTYRALIAWRKEAMEAQGHVVAYEALRTLLEALERDFRVADTAISSRIATRIRGALDDATITINQATGGNNAAGDD